MAEYEGGSIFGCTFEAADSEAAEKHGKELAQRYADLRGIPLVSCRVKKGSGVVPALSFDDAPITTKTWPSG